MTETVSTLEQLRALITGALPHDDERRALALSLFIGLQDELSALKRRGSADRRAEERRAFDRYFAAALELCKDEPDPIGAALHKAETMMEKRRKRSPR